MPNENKHNDIKQNRQYIERKIYRSDTLKNTNIQKMTQTERQEVEKEKIKNLGDL